MLYFQIRFYCKQVLFLTVVFLFATSCDRNVKFTPQNIVLNSTEKFLTSNEEKNFKMLQSEQVFTQEFLEKNKTVISFQIKDNQGNFVQSIAESSLTIKENQAAVTQFSLNKNSLEIRSVVDIAFAVDVTGSMTSTIESAKVRLINFIKKSRESGYHTRICLITFGDYTLQKCDKFYDNDPADATTLVQVAELISEITKLKALKGKQDPGGADLNENPMRAVIDAAQASWNPQHQKFLILLTDDGFLYSPNNQGAVGSLAPKYSEIKESLKQSQIKVFAVTPSLPGYNRQFGSEESIVSLSQGEWFNYSDLISGKITLDTILNRIIIQINTTFFAEYVADEVDEIEAAKPISDRNIKIQLIDANLGQLQSIQYKSNLPLGRQQYKNEFKITSKKILKDTLKVYLQGEELKSGYQVLDSGAIKFDKAPRADSKIKVVYQYALVKDAIILQPIILNKKINVSESQITLNGYVAKLEDYKLIQTLENQYSLVFADSVLSERDPYKIIEHQGLNVIIKYKYSE